MPEEQLRRTENNPRQKGVNLHS